MTVETLPWTLPDGMEVLITWLTPLGPTEDEKPDNSPLPFRMVNKIIGTDDELTEAGHYSVHTFAADKPTAQTEAQATHDRMLYLVSRFTGQQPVTLESGLVVQADNVKVIETPHWIQWVDDNSIHRFVATYQVDLRYIARPT